MKLNDYTTEQLAMLKQLEYLCSFLETPKKLPSYAILDKTCIQPKYWRKLLDGGIVINTGTCTTKPCYQWNSIQPNIYMAIETLKDRPDYNDTYNEIEGINEEQKDSILRVSDKWCPRILEKKEDPAINVEFGDFWNLYDKKVGDKSVIERAWKSLKPKDREDVMAYIPKYIESQPDKKYRKDPIRFIRNKTWKDEIMKKENTLMAVTITSGDHYLSKYTDHQLWDELKRRGYTIENNGIIKKLD